MSQGNRLRARVVVAAEEALARQKAVSPVDVCLGLGWLQARNVDDWRYGRAPTLEDYLPVGGEKLDDLIEHFERWVADKGLKPTEVAYIATTRDRRGLRFTKRGDDKTERAWGTQWMPPGLLEKQSERITRRQSTPPDLVVVDPVKDFACAECGEGGGLLIMDDKGPLCMTCADMDHLVFLPAGDAALTRRAKKASRLSAVVVRWSRTRKRYERQGLLVEEAALEQAEQQCLADEEIRMRRRERDAERRAEEDVEFQGRFAAEIRRLYPSCPTGRADAIARHAALRGSGRVGRSAAARALDPRAITLAVAASIRHEDTNYDDLLMSGISREDARDRIRASIDRVLATWS
jgi:hypothetical protein